jgi:hypothetical protein
MPGPTCSKPVVSRGRSGSPMSGAVGHFGIAAELVVVHPRKLRASDKGPARRCLRRLNFARQESGPRATRSEGSPRLHYSRMFEPKPQGRLGTSLTKRARSIYKTSLQYAIRSRIRGAEHFRLIYFFDTATRAWLPFAPTNCDFAISDPAKQSSSGAVSALRGEKHEQHGRQD